MAAFAAGSFLLLFVGGALLNLAVQHGRLTRQHFFLAVGSLAATVSVAIVFAGFYQYEMAASLAFVGLAMTILMVISSPQGVRTAPRKLPKKQYRIPHMPVDLAAVPHVPYDALAETVTMQFHFHAEIDGATASQFLSLCRQAENLPRRTVFLLLNTNGGETRYMDIIRAAIRRLARIHDVYIVAHGLCASAGMSLLTALPVGRRLALEHTEFLIHGNLVTEEDTVDGTERKISDGELSDRWLHSLNYGDTVLTARICEECEGITPEAMDHILKHQLDYVFYTNEALALGVIGGVVDI